MFTVQAGRVLFPETGDLTWPWSVDLGRPLSLELTFVAVPGSGYGGSCVALKVDVASRGGPEAVEDVETEL
jgi:hypothetical protein